MRSAPVSSRCCSSSSTTTTSTTSITTSSRRFLGAHSTHGRRHSGSRTPPQLRVQLLVASPAPRRHARSPRPTAAAAGAGAGEDSASGAAADGSASLEEALLLAYLACQNRSLFAAQCFVEAVLDAYTAGANVDALQTGLALRNMRAGGDLLQAQDADLLLSWIILIMLTAQEVGVPKQLQADADAAAGQQDAQEQQPSANEPGSGSAADAAAAAAAGITTSFSREVLGLLAFVKQAAKLYFEEGYSVQKLQSLQATVAADPAQGQSAALQMMQQYTRLVLISLEVAAGSRLPTARPLTNPASLDAPSGYTAAFAAGGRQQRDWQQQAGAPGGGDQASAVGGDAAAAAGALVTAAALSRGRGGLRAQAVRLMTAFVGAAIGSPHSLRAFVLGALAAYEAGVPAAALHSQLSEAEFAQSGGLVPARPAPEVLIDVNRALFGRWLSLVYMAAAQLNAVFPGADAAPGWAWYGGEDEVQANAAAAFVAQALLRLQQEEAEAAAEQAAAAGGQQQQDEAAALLDTAAPREDPLVARIKSSPEAAAQLDAASRQLQAELSERGTLRGREVPVMVKVPDPSLAATSGAVRVWQQQLELVAAVYAAMRALTAAQ